jgi:hypothetical protein
LWCGFVGACGGAQGLVVKAVANANAQFNSGAEGPVKCSV